MRALHLSSLRLSPLHWSHLSSVCLASLFAVGLCAGCTAISATEQSTGCPASVTASAIAPVSCGRNGWQNGGVVTNRNGNGPHVEVWGPPTTLPTGRD